MRPLANHLLVPLAAALLAGAGLAQQASFTPVPDMSPLANMRDVTPDGTIAVGQGFNGAFYWRWQTDPMPTEIGGISANAVSDDGTVIAGQMIDPVSGMETAGIWTAATGWESIGWLPGAPTGCGTISSAYDISGDGTTIVGLSWAPGTCLGRAFRWTEATGIEQLQVLGNDRNRASVIASDGSLIGGFAQGTFNRTPAIWFPDGTGTIFDIDLVGEVMGVADDGSAIVGQLSGQSFLQQNGGPLEPLPGTQALDITEDQQLVIGFDQPAWIFRPGVGKQDLQALLTGLGVPGVPALGVVTKTSADGTVIVGHTFFQGAWIVTLPHRPLLQPYGCGVNPAGSLTVVSGLPALGQQIVLGVDNPLGTQPAGSLPLLSFSTQPALQFPCGLLLPGLGMGAPGTNGELLLGVVPPNPILTLVGPLWTGPGSPAPFPLFFPPDPILCGLSLYAQGVLWDYTGTSGIPFGLTGANQLMLGTDF